MSKTNSTLSRRLLQRIACVSGALSTGLFTAYAAQAIEITDPATQFQPGSIICVNNPSYLCQNPNRFSSPWFHLPEDFKTEAHTSPLTADQQAELQQALDQHNNTDLQSGAFICTHNFNANCGVQ